MAFTALPKRLYYFLICDYTSIKLEVAEEAVVAKVAAVLAH